MSKEAKEEPCENDSRPRHFSRRLACDTQRGRGGELKGEDTNGTAD